MSLAAGKLNTDAYWDLVVGAPGESIGADTQTGVFITMLGHPNGLNAANNDLIIYQDIAGIEEDCEDLDWFAWSVAIVDADNDGFGDVIVGVPGDDAGGVADAGVMHVIRGSGAGVTADGDQLWHQGSGGIADDPEMGDMFGYAVGGGRLNADGAGDVVVGVRLEDTAGFTDTGAVHVLYGATGGLTSAGSGFFDAASIGGASRANGQVFGHDLRAGQADGDGPLEVFVSVPTGGIGGAKVMILDNTGSGLTGSSVVWQPAAVVTQATLASLEAAADVVAWESPYVPGSMTVTVKVGLDDWQAATQHVVGNYLVDGASKTYGWFVDVDGGVVRLGWGDGTTTAHSATSTSSVPGADGEAVWLRVVFDPEPGTVGFAYRLADTGGFTTLGSTVSTGATTMVNPGEPGFVGKTSSAGSTGLEGDLFGVTVASDVDASVWEVDFTVCAAPAQSCTQDGRTWSANAAAGIRAPGVGGTLITFAHDPVSGGPHAVASRTSPQGTVSYSYDAVGNMVADSEGVSLGWDARNRLVAWSDGTDEHSFAYDAAGERVSRDDGTTTTVFLGDVEIDSTGEARTYYGFNGQAVAIRTTSGSTSTLEVVLADHLGSPQVVYDPASGTVTGTRLHRPYGDTRDESGVLPGGRGYTGQQTDPTGLMYYGARYYTPELMTFISADTVVPDPGSAIGLNRYAYVADNPVNLTDPTGHCWWVPNSENGPCPGAGVARDVAKFAREHGPAVLTAVAVAAACTANPLLCTVGASVAYGATDRFTHGQNPADPEGLTVDTLLGLGGYGVAKTLSALARSSIGNRLLGRLLPGPDEAIAGTSRLAPQATGHLDEAFHYTFKGAAASIERTGLKPGSYLTPDGRLSPLQAQIDLALPPNRGLTDAVFRVDLNGLRQAGYPIPAITRVGPSFNMPGGGFEMQFPYRIPPEFIKLVGAG